MVLRQPFGGRGKSCFGPGMKAGGPNYVAQFMELADRQAIASPGQPPKISIWPRGSRCYVAGRDIDPSAVGASNGSG